MLACSLVEKTNNLKKKKKIDYRPTPHKTCTRDKNYHIGGLGKFRVPS